MSDFLGNFSNENYKQKSPSSAQIQAEQPEQWAGQPPVAPKASHRDYVPENARDEIFERDPNSGRRRRKRIVFAILGMVACLFLIVFLVYATKMVKLPDFVGAYADKAQVWAVQNNIFLDEKEAFSMDYARGVVISQTPAAPGRLLRGGSMEVVVSRGVDPQELMKVPDFTAAHVSDIEKWIGEHKAENASITREFSDTIPADQFIRKEYRASNVSDENYKRADRMTIYVSRGPQQFEQNITVPDFKDKMEAEASLWANNQGIKLTSQKAYSETVLPGFIIRQSIAAEEKIAKNEELTITISKGKAVYAPSFTGLTKEEASITASTAGIMVSFIDQYHNSVVTGRFITQSVSAGSILEDGKNSILAYYSLGRPFVPDLAGQKENQVAMLFADMNNKKANLTYKLEYVSDSQVQKGSVIFNTKANSTVSVGSTIIVTISKGARITIGNYLDKNIHAEEMLLETNRFRNLGLKYTIQYVSSSKESGTILKQSIAPESQMDAADHLLVLEVAN